MKMNNWVENIESIALAMMAMTNKYISIRINSVEQMCRNRSFALGELTSTLMTQSIYFHLVCLRSAHKIVVRRLSVCHAVRLFTYWNSSANPYNGMHTNTALTLTPALPTEWHSRFISHCVSISYGSISVWLTTNATYESIFESTEEHSHGRWHF